jgi:flavin reductase (DIM6/NTAB) family NADH-FMN oxidoreductase RutF
MKKWKENFKKIDIDNFNENLFELIGKEWFLITAGTPGNFNMMTASWGTAGIFWNKPITISFVRPTRHTFGFMEESDVYTLSFLGKENRKILNFCGSHSGSDTNKLKETGLLPLETEEGSIGYEQARIVIECRKIYYDDLKPVFILPENVDDEIYPAKDYHRAYYGEILNIYVKNE